MLWDEYFSRVYHDKFLEWYAQRVAIPLMSTAEVKAPFEHLSVEINELQPTAGV